MYASEVESKMESFCHFDVIHLHGKVQDQAEVFPFNLGKIYPPDLDISKSWYIKFKVWGHSKGELVIRREMGGMNKVHNKNDSR